MSHTPGPWMVTDDGLGVCVATGNYKTEGTDDWTIADCQHGWCQCEANARLIAAAPELLEACEAVLPTIESLVFNCKNPSEVELLDQVQQAIKKAKGEPK